MQLKVYKFLRAVGIAVLVVTALVLFTKCRTLQHDKETYSPTITQPTLTPEQKNYIKDLELDSLNGGNARPSIAKKALLHTNGVKFDWTKYYPLPKNCKKCKITIGDNSGNTNKSEVNTEITAKKEGQVNTGDDGKIEKTVAEKNANQQKGEGNTSTTAAKKSGGTVVPWWLSAVALIVGYIAYKILKPRLFP